jgi:hypothetical protein
MSPIIYVYCTEVRTGHIIDRIVELAVLACVEELDVAIVGDNPYCRISIFQVPYPRIPMLSPACEGLSSGRNSDWIVQYVVSSQIERIVCDGPALKEMAHMPRTWALVWHSNRRTKLFGGIPTSGEMVMNDHIQVAHTVPQAGCLYGPLLGQRYVDSASPASTRMWVQDPAP